VRNRSFQAGFFFMMILIYTLKNQIEAQVIKAALQEAGIKFVIRTFEDSAYDGIFIPQKGYGQVLVEEKDKQKAKEIIMALG
jgi:signal recognition particle subunit SEC65